MQCLTNLPRGDGFGSQFQTILWTMLFAESQGVAFMYTKIHEMDMISNITKADVENENTVEEVTEYMGFRKHYPPSEAWVPRISHELVYPVVEDNMERIFQGAPFLRFKTLFYSDKSSRFNNAFINVAVHIRRLGSFETRLNRFREGTHNVPFENYVSVMNRIRRDYPGRHIRFHIYSQGVEGDFQELASEDTTFHLNEKVLDTFTDLVFADVLVTTRSSFSYTAALLNSKDIYYLPFWHPPRDHWKKW